MIITSAIPYRKEAVALLAGLELPHGDLPPQLDNFYVMLAGEEVIGLAGLEIYKTTGLLRSVAVKQDYQTQGIAAKLLEKVTECALRKKLEGLVLLTETAPDYFRRHGFSLIERKQVPQAVQASSEFRSVCPVSATVMYKLLKT